jgi:6-phosphofructokinase 1
VIVASEGTQYEDGTFLTESGLKDAFGHSQLGGLAPNLAQMVKDELGYKYHWAVADYLQRSARHIASLTDVKQAYDLGEAAVEMALQGKNAIMPCIVRGTGKRYRWTIGEAPLKEVANREKKMPRGYITRDGFGITDDARKYLAPLITGESHPEYHNGLPRYVKLKNVAVPRKLDTDFEV